MIEERTMKKVPARKRVHFKVEADPDSKIYVAGSFNNWNAAKNSLKYKNGIFSTSILVPQGRHEYKFVINGIWTVDPYCADWTPNGHGSLNSVIVVE